MHDVATSDNATHEVRSGIRGLLSVAPLFTLFTRTVARQRVYGDFIRSHVDPGPGRRLLDCGCGTGRLLDHLDPDVQYTGFDLSEAYVRRAREQYGSRGQFIAAGADDPDLQFDAPFDSILCGGVLHHLPDQVAMELLRRTANWTGDEGRLVTYDTCVFPDSKRLARWFMKRDRGQHVRPAEEYVALARTAFASVETFELRNLNRIPYDSLVMICKRPLSSCDSDDDG